MHQERIGLGIIYVVRGRQYSGADLSVHIASGHVNTKHDLYLRMLGSNVEVYHLDRCL